MSHASITAIAGVENARPLPEKSRTFLLDVQMYLGPDVDPFIACFRYYNGNNLPFNEPGLFLIHATLSKYSESLFESLRSPVLEMKDYDAVGDVVFIIPLPNLSEDALLNYPFVHICGTVKTSDKPAATFDIDPDQYTQITPTGQFPIRAVILDSPRFKNKKPVGAIIYVGGYLTEVIRDPQTSLPERFGMNADQFCFLSRNTGPPKAGGGSASPAPKTPGRSRLQKFFRSPAGGRPSQAAPETQSPTPATVILRWPPIMVHPTITRSSPSDRTSAVKPTPPPQSYQTPQLLTRCR